MAEKEKDQRVQDAEYARGVYLELIEKGRSALDGIIEVAESTEHPRAYEVLATMIKQVGDVTDGLMELHKKKHEAIEATTPKQLPGSERSDVDQAKIGFVGTFDDLQDLFEEAAAKGARAKEISEAVDVTDYTEKDGKT